MSTEKPNSVAEAVAQLRGSLKLSKEKFAQKLGCSLQTVIRWESGRAEISAGNLVKLWELARRDAPTCASVFAGETVEIRHMIVVDVISEMDRFLNILSRLQNRLGRVIIDGIDSGMTEEFLTLV